MFASTTFYSILTINNHYSEYLLFLFWEITNWKILENLVLKNVLNTIMMPNLYKATNTKSIFRERKKVFVVKFFSLSCDLYNEFMKYLQIFYSWCSYTN